MGHGPGRPIKTGGRPHGHGGRRDSTSSSYTPHHMGSGLGGPSKHTGRRMGRAERPIQNPYPIGRGPVRPIISELGGPSMFHGPARPINFRKVSSGPAEPIAFVKVSARPGPAGHNSQIVPARPRQTAHDKPCKTLLKIRPFFAYRAKTPVHTVVRTGCHYIVSTSVRPSVYV